MAGAEWIVAALIGASTLLAALYFRGRDAGKKQLLLELRLDGYDVKTYSVVEPGRGRHVVRVWRDNRWTDVSR